MENILENQV